MARSNMARKLVNKSSSLLIARQITEIRGGSKSVIRVMVRLYESVLIPQALHVMSRYTVMYVLTNEKLPIFYLWQIIDCCAARGPALIAPHTMQPRHIDMYTAHTQQEKYPPPPPPPPPPRGYSALDLYPDPRI